MRRRPPACIVLMPSSKPDHASQYFSRLRSAAMHFGALCDANRMLEIVGHLHADRPRLHDQSCQCKEAATQQPSIQTLS